MATAKPTPKNCPHEAFVRGCPACERADVERQQIDAANFYYQAHDRWDSLHKELTSGKVHTAQDRKTLEASVQEAKAIHDEAEARVQTLTEQYKKALSIDDGLAAVSRDSNAEVYQSHAEEWLYELQQRYLDSTGGMIELPPRQSLQAERPHLHAEGRSEVMDYTATRATRDIRLSNPMGYNLAVLMAGEQGVSVNDRPGRPGEPATISVGAAVDMFDPSGQPRVVVDADLIKADVEDTPDIGNLSVDPSDAKVAAPQVDKAEELEVVVDADQRAMTSTTGPTNKLSEEDERLFEDTKLKGNYTSHLRETLGYYAANAREIASEDDDNEDPPDEINLGPPTWDGFTTWFYRQKAAAEAEADGNFVRDKLRPRRQERITARSQTSAKVKDWSRDPYGSLANDPQLRRNNTASLAFRRKMDAEDLERSKK